MKILLEHILYIVYAIKDECKKKNGVVTLRFKQQESGGREGEQRPHQLPRLSLSWLTRAFRNNRIEKINLKKLKIETQKAIDSMKDKS